MTEHETAASPRAGWHLWMVGIFGILWNGFGCFDWTMSVTQNQAYLGQFPEEIVTYLAAAPWWTYAIWAVGVFGGLAGSVALLMKRALALAIFAVSFLAALISMTIGWTDESAPVMEGTEFMPVVILVLALGFVAYAYWQKRRGVLR